MASLWPDDFEESKANPPRLVFDEQGKVLEQITKGLVFGEVRQVLQEFDPYTFGVMGKAFVFDFDLVGRNLGDYRFTLLWFAHDISLYPLNIKLDDQVAKELMSDAKDTHSVDNQEELEAFLKEVFATKRVKTVIGSIMRLSKT